MASELLEKESDRFWNRVNIALLIQAALLALLGGAASEGPLVVAVAGGLGAAFSLLGWGLTTKGCSYVERWTAVVLDIEVKLKAELGAAFIPLRHENDLKRLSDKGTPVPLKSSTSQMKTAFLVLFLFWAGVVVWSGREALGEESGADDYDVIVALRSA